MIDPPKNLSGPGDHGGRIRKLRIASANRLPDLVIAALQERRALHAYALADRWRRIAGPSVASLLARAEASHQMGYSDYALDDILKGLDLDPTHPNLNSKLADWGNDKQKAQAARMLIGQSYRDIEKGLLILAQGSTPGAGMVQFVGGLAEGWAVWRSSSRARLRLGNEQPLYIDLQADDNHPWSGFFGCATKIAVDLTNRLISKMTLMIDAVEVASATQNPRWTAFEEVPLPCSPSTMTIIAPIYDDYTATRACLETAEAAIHAVKDAQILALDDCSPNAALKTLVRDFGERPQCYSRVNSHNLGYVGTVNRALNLVPKGDILLLNADTLLPVDCLDRLRRIAQSDPTIGTINPLSNHGEFVSFPIPFVENEVNENDWRQIDSAAAAVNDLIAIDIPSGTGFCIYITRACLDQIGVLSQHYVSGYLEDADFGLCAREAGFRNVCAPSIFVPHLGSRSFKGDKARLVARNRQILARRFPDYETECDAFIVMDPLAAARARIEAAIAHNAPQRRLILGPARLNISMRARMEQLATQRIDAMMAAFSYDGKQWSAVLSAALQRAPYRLQLPFDAAVNNFYAELTKWPFDRIEIITAQDLPIDLIKGLFSLTPSIDRLIVETPFVQKNTLPCVSWDVCASWECERQMGQAHRFSPGTIPSFGGHNEATPHMKFDAFPFERVIGVDAMSRQACKKLRQAASDFASCEAPKDLIQPASIADPHGALGVILPYETPECLHLLRKLSHAMNDLAQDIILFGQTSIDQRLMAGGLFVTGPIASSEISRSIEQFGITRFFLPLRCGGFWLLEQYRSRRFVPAAYFDWSDCLFEQDPRDLSLSSALCDAKAISRLSNWLQETT